MSQWKECDDATTTYFTNALSELLDQSVSVKVAKQCVSDGIKLTRATATYWLHGSESSSKVSKEVLLLEGEDLDLPKFHLIPKRGGLLGTFVGLANQFLTGSHQGITFDHSPEFSQRYYLKSWAESAVRILFTPKVVSHLAVNPGLDVRGSNRFLMISLNRIVGSEDAFISSSLDIFNLLQDGEALLDAQPDVAREASVSEKMQAASRMGRLGSMMQKQLRKNAVTPEELKKIKMEASPRNIPPGIRRQVLGQDLTLLWCSFLFFGSLALLGSMFCPDNLGKILIGSSGLLCIVVGIAAGFFLTRSKNRKLGAIRDGVLTTGTVTNIRETGTMVNNVLIFKASVAFERGGREVTQEFSVTGDTVTKARRMMNSKETVDLLVSDHAVVCLDMLTIWE